MAVKYMTDMDALEIGLHPSQRPARYMNWVTFTCGCNINSLGVLKHKKTGYHLSDFFGTDDLCIRELLHEVKYIGRVLIIEYEGALYAAETMNDSPWIIYGRLR